MKLIALEQDKLKAETLRAKVDASISAQSMDALKSMLSDD
jgi:hypothetical protein